MATVFTRIINGELPGRFVWRDETCVAFLSIHPLKPGHTLVVPREEVDHWLDLSREQTHHLMEISQRLGKALDHAFAPKKVGLMIAGLEVPHVHVHLVPMNHIHDLDFANQDTQASPQDLDTAADEIRRSLQDLGLSGDK